MIVIYTCLYMLYVLQQNCCKGHDHGKTNIIFKLTYQPFLKSNLVRGTTCKIRPQQGNILL